MPMVGQRKRNHVSSALPIGRVRSRVRTTNVLFVLPSVIIVIGLLLYPVASSVYYSFTNRNLLRATYETVGLSNYTDLLANPEFWSAFGFSVKWTIASIVGQLVFGFLAAAAIERVPRLGGMYQTLLIVPWAFPPIITAFAWTWILHDVDGILPNLLMQLGLTDATVSLLARPGTVFWTVLAINVWFGIPLFMVNILAAMKTIPPEELEAARVDGAGAVQMFWYITLPHIRRVVGLLVVLRVIWVFNNFEMVFLLTGGGPGSLTTTLPIFAYRTGWGLHQLGVASAVTVLLLLFLLALAAMAFRLINRWEGQAA